MSDVRQLLDTIQHGDPKAAEELVPLVYDELRKLAAHKMANEAAGHTLQPTALDRPQSKPLRAGQTLLAYTTITRPARLPRACHFQPAI